MQVVCNDGTTFDCTGYEVVDGGVKCYSELVHEASETEERYRPDRDRFQIGYVPNWALQYIVPDGVTPMAAATDARGEAQGGAEPTGAAPQQAPVGGGTAPATGGTGPSGGVQNAAAGRGDAGSRGPVGGASAGRSNEFGPRR